MRSLRQECATDTARFRVPLNREGWEAGKYLVYRLYKEEGLTLKRMKPAGKRKAARHRQDRFKATAPDQVCTQEKRLP